MESVVILLAGVTNIVLAIVDADGRLVTIDTIALAVLCNVLRLVAVASVPTVVFTELTLVLIVFAVFCNALRLVAVAKPDVADVIPAAVAVVPLANVTVPVLVTVLPPI